MAMIMSVFMFLQRILLDKATLRNLIIVIPCDTERPVGILASLDPSYVKR